MKRPIILSVCCYTLLLLSSVFLLSLAAVNFIEGLGVNAEAEVMKITTVPVWLANTLSVLGCMIGIISAIFMLKGEKWGRILLLVWMFGGTAMGLVFTKNVNMVLMENLPIFIILALLFLPNISRYFSSRTQ